jgi:hypothetical protein
LSQQSSGVCAGFWSPPFPIQRADGRPVYVERGVIAPYGRRTLLLGTPTIFWLGTDQIVPAKMATTDTSQVRWSFTQAGALIDVSGTADGVPMIDIATFRRAPQLIGVRDGRLSVAWASGDRSPTPKNEPYPPATRVEVATFDGVRWGPPVTIMRARTIELSDVPALRIGPALDLDVVAATATDSAATFLRVARRDGSRWSTVDWRSAVRFVYAEAVPLSDGSMVVVMISAPQHGGVGVYSIRAVGSGDGVTWTPPVLIDSIPGEFTYLATAHLGDDSLVVVRARSLKEREGGGTMMTALSVDGGRNWKQMLPLALGALLRPKLVVDAGGRLHMIYRDATDAGVLNSPGVIMHSIWRAGAWTSPDAVSADASMTEPAAGAAAGGGVLATWTEASMQQQGFMPKTMGRQWTPGCPPD